MNAVSRLWLRNGVYESGFGDPEVVAATCAVSDAVDASRLGREIETELFYTPEPRVPAHWPCAPGCEVCP